MARKINTKPLLRPVRAALVKTAGVLLKNDKDIDEHLGELLLDVQRANVYGDGKTFVDLIPAGRLRSIREEYLLVKNDPYFDLREFVSRHFHDGAGVAGKRPYKSNSAHAPIEHINELWAFLERHNQVSSGTLIALPYPYIVPGGRFNEQFYWDTYFIMLGLAAAGMWRNIEGMIKNYAHLIRRYGYIPTANRTYLTSRSQPPFFSHMVVLLAGKQSNRAYRENLPYLLAEYRFWMKGRAKIEGTENGAFRRVVEMPNGSFLNRYYDNKSTPRPESLREDIETAEASKRVDASRLYLHLRAAAESGWDFSSRWFHDPLDIKTIHTADIIPVDLNCLLYHLEMTIAKAYRVSLNAVQSHQFKKRAKARAAAIDAYLWNEEEGFYVDYNFHMGAQTGVKSLAAVFPLYVGIASQKQAHSVVKVLEKEFLKQGGLLTTLVTNGQQWDSPNGWAPLHWVAIEGLRRYGHDKLADEIMSRWVAVNERVYRSSGRFVEKYNVLQGDGLGGGGEYVLQDGFGWTNGVYQALKLGFSPRDL